MKIKAEDDIWTSRRKIIRSTLKPMVKRQIERKKSAVEKAKNSPEEKAVDIDDKKKKPTGLLVSAFFIAVSATVLRLGGRTAFVNMLGLDFVTGSGIRTQVNDFVEFFHSLGDTSQYAAFFLAWLAAKVFCIDAFTIVLALSSGVLFGGIFQGTAVSVVCSSTASLFVFFLSRYVIYIPFPSSLLHEDFISLPGIIDRTVLFGDKKNMSGIWSCIYLLQEGSALKVCCVSYFC